MNTFTDSESAGLRGPGPAICLLLFTALCGCGSQAPRDAPTTSRDDEPLRVTASATAGEQQLGSAEVRYAIGDELVPTVTADDWATYGDAVAVFTVVEESVDSTLNEPLVPRRVIIRLDQPVWTSPEGARHPFPKTLEFTVAGWKGSDGSDPPTDINSLPRLSLADSSRVEIGHSYVAGFYWESQPCSPNSQDGSFLLLSSGPGLLPYDGSQVGVGEFEGTVRAYEEAAAAVVGPGTAGYGMDDQAFGLTADRLAVILDRTSVSKGAGEVPHPHPEDCADSE